MTSPCLKDSGVIFFRIGFFKLQLLFMSSKAKTFSQNLYWHYPSDSCVVYRDVPGIGDVVPKENRILDRGDLVKELVDLFLVTGLVFSGIGSTP